MKIDRSVLFEVRNRFRRLPEHTIGVSSEMDKGLEPTYLYGLHHRVHEQLIHDAGLLIPFASSAQP